MIYLDSPALAKLVQADVESDALALWLEGHVDEPWVSSVVLEIEIFRAAVRSQAEAAVGLRELLDTVELIELSPAIRVLAQATEPPSLRSLAAMHLGTALSITGLTAFVTYDKRLAEAAQIAGLPVFSPGVA